LERHLEQHLERHLEDKKNRSQVVKTAAMNEFVNCPEFPFKPKGFQSLGHRDKMQVVGWQSAIRGLVTTYYAYVERASAN
jgi:hypothetical protein